MGNKEVNRSTLKMSSGQNVQLDQTKASDGTQPGHTDVLRHFQACFFAMSRLASFQWTFLDTELENKSAELLSAIVKQTCLHPVCRRFPPAVRYRRLFLRELIRRQEAAECEPVDELYDALAEVLRAAEGPECYKTYFLPCVGAVSLLERVALISEGTTGLVTWEAALYLAEWALDHQQAFSGRTVLELGSGVGLTGIAICRSCSPSRYVFSDCHPAVLHALRGNVQLNGLDGPSVCVEDLDWTAATDEQLREIGADTVIAADVVYDPEVAGALVKLLSRILRGSRPEVAPVVLVCSTVRNPETYGGFKQQLGAAGISHHVITGPVGHTFPFERVSAIEMIQLHI